ncbi:MAG: DUF5615 family PIN-like protein [Deltaproteobacteria bacterium]|nr:DUF5615 family PIN-like protein [Deltaproteobacteria bacterium]
MAEELRTAHGIDAVHVRDRGGLGTTDQAVFALAFREDRVVVTSNVKDFEHLARHSSIHGGIVLIAEGDLGRQEQLAIVLLALAAVEARGDLVNTVLRIGLAGTPRFERLPR